MVLAMVPLAVPGLLLCGRRNVRCDDWSTYAHDNARSAVTSGALRLPLTRAWQYRSRVRPRPAWDEPATWDGWNKVHDLRNRVDFDKAMHVAVTADSVYFGSSVDGRVYCLDASTGQARWAFFTEAPIRLAPTLYSGRVFAGSDDGYLYCLNADDGSLSWKQRIAPADRRLPADGWMVSLWPVRAGVAVDQDVVFCGAGIFPTEGIYLCAVDADSGDVLWRQSQEDLPLQGYILASTRYLFVPTGRGGPVVFDRADGRRVRTLDEGRGTFALLSQGTLFTNAGRDGRHLIATADEGGEQLAFFAGNHMIAEHGIAYLQAKNHLMALHRSRYLELVRQHNDLAARHEVLQKEIHEGKQNGDKPAVQRLQAQSADVDRQMADRKQQMKSCALWKTDVDGAFSMILADQILLAGGAGRVDAWDCESGRHLWQDTVDGRAYGLAAAHGRLIVSTDAGSLHCFGTPAQTARVAAEENP